MEIGDASFNIKGRCWDLVVRQFYHANRIARKFEIQPLPSTSTDQVKWYCRAADFF